MLNFTTNCNDLVRNDEWIFAAFLVVRELVRQTAACLRVVLLLHPLDWGHGFLRTKMN